MKTYQQTKAAYIADHIAKPLAQPERRLSALESLEKKFKAKYPEALQDKMLFANISKPYFTKLYECLKGNALSGADKSVITGLYKFSK